MPVSHSLNALLPIFDWNWWQLFVLFLIADWGIILLIKFFEPLGWKRAYWRSAIYGDIFLPVGIASAAVVTQHTTLTPSWYTARWWNWLILVLGCLIIIGIELYLIHPKNGHYSWRRLLAPSKLWHTVIFPPMFYCSIITLIPLVTTRRPLWAFGLTLLGYGCWLATYVSDLIWPPDHSRTH